MRTFLTSMLLSTATLWAGAGQSFAHEVNGYDDGCGHETAPSQAYGPISVAADPVTLNVSQDASGNVMAWVVESRVPLSRLADSRLRIGFQGYAAGGVDSTTLYYSAANQAYYGQLPAGVWLGSAPMWAQVDLAEVITAPAPPVVHVQPQYQFSYPYTYAYPYQNYRRPVVVVRPRALPRRVVIPVYPRRYIPAPPVVRARTHDGRRFDGHWRDGRFDGRRDGRFDRDRRFDDRRRHRDHDHDRRNGGRFDR